jgi:hypothetical protein
VSLVAFLAWVYLWGMSGRLKYYIAVFVCGICAGGAAMWFVVKPPKSAGDTVVVKRISGTPVVHRDFSYKGKDISFITESKGNGLSKTVIPKRNIPEARAWMDFVNGIGISVLYDFSGQWVQIYQVNYWRRFGRVSVGCGVSAGKNHVGINVGAMFWF